jgi:hypothetical protein
MSLWHPKSNHKGRPYNNIYQHNIGQNDHKELNNKLATIIIQSLLSYFLLDTKKIIVKMDNICAVVDLFRYKTKTWGGVTGG